MLKSGLRLYCYTGAPIYSPVIVTEYSRYVDQLEFTSVAPGGFGELTARLRIKRSRVPRPELGMFARCALMAGRTCLFLGELTDPAISASQSDGEYVQIDALGLGNALRDDPRIITYTNQTLQQIAQAQVTFHTVTTQEWPLDSDLTQIFPDNPAGSYSIPFDNNNVEEIFGAVALYGGDYNWGVEAHPVNIDYAGFPTGRVFVRARDLTTTSYIAYELARDISAYTFDPSAERAYNFIEVDYTTSSGGVGKAYAQDSRMGASYSQGTMPFRFRKYARDFTGNPAAVGVTQAQNIANLYLSEFKNPSYKGTVTLLRLRDAYGVEQPLWSCLAGNNIYLPEFALLGNQLPLGATAGVNQHYIVEARYREGSGGQQQLDLTLNYFPDRAEIQIARLQLEADNAARSGKVQQVVQQLGAPINGYVSWQFSNAISGQTTGVGQTFPAMASQAPTSVTLHQIAISNLTGITANAFSVFGCNFYGAVSANGAGYYQGTFATSGNCLLAVNHADGRFAHHCDGCDRVFGDLGIEEQAGHARVSRVFGAAPGQSALAVTCPECGQVEAFNTALTARDEAAGLSARRAEQARLIRQLMAHPLVGLEVA